MSTFESILSRLAGLDSMLKHIRLGDNVVWQVSSMKDYLFSGDVIPSRRLPAFRRPLSFSWIFTQMSKAYM